MQFRKPQESVSGLAEYYWPATTESVGTVLLQHGFAEYAQRYDQYYAKLIGRLNQAGFDVHAFDLPGHGNSPGDRRQVDIGQAVQTHLAFRKRLSGDRPVFLFGHSLGGAITAASVLKQPQDIAGVVLSGPALINLPGFLVGGVGKLSDRYPSLPFKNLAPNAMTRSKEILAAVDADTMMCRGKMPLGVIGSLCRSNRELWAHLKEWTVPTLLVHGSKDKYTNPNDTRRFFKSIQSEDKTLNIIQGGFHETLNDPGGERIADDIVKWLQKHV